MSFYSYNSDKMDPSLVKVPPMKDLTADNITENVHKINSLCEDERMKYVLERLVSHLHDFARETRLSMPEWMTGLLFLTEVGKICSDVRQVSIHAGMLFSREGQALIMLMVIGIHPSQRCPGSLPVSRQHRPPQTAWLDGRHCPGPVPHTRRQRDLCWLIPVS